MSHLLQTFVNEDNQPFAAFFWGSSDQGVTKDQMIREYLDREELVDNLLEASDIHTFYLRKDDGEDGIASEGRPWIFCNKEAAGAQVATGVKF